ncbi:MAG TPA: lipopolysaccharide heptosyltransferase II [Telluria sp.]
MMWIFAPHMDDSVDIARTLVISPNWIGDAVMAQPLVRALKERQPARPIDVLAPAWVAPVWRATAEVDSVVETPFRHDALQLGERRSLARSLRRRGYVEAYVLPNAFKSALIPWLAGIPRRVGYRGEMRYGLINVMHRDDPASPRPMTRFYAALAAAPGAASGVAPADPALTVSAAQKLGARAALGLAAEAPVVAFAPGAEFGPAKRWPAAHFAELARMIVQARPDVHILLLGSASDAPVCKEIAAAAPGVHNLAGATSLQDAIALLAGATALVTNDSGLMHIACALQRPVVAIYGPTDPRHTPPLSELAAVLWLHLDCAPCQQRSCPLGHHHCMTNISPGMAWRPLAPLVRTELSGARQS